MLNNAYEIEWSQGCCLFSIKPSVSSYKYKGKPLRFSKTGNPKMEEAYATHYVMKAKSGFDRQRTD